MLRKTTIALAALATIGTAALAPTTASASYWHHGHGYGHGHYKSYGFKSWGYAPRYAGYSCWRTKWVQGYYGWRQVRVNVCGY